MSHYSVAVFTTDKNQSVDELLAPYELNFPDIPDGESVVQPIEPGTKWDDYQIGGHYKGHLLLKDTKKSDRSAKRRKFYKTVGCDSALVSDINFEAMKERDKAELCPYEEAMTDAFDSEEHMREIYPTEEEYVKLSTAFGTYAVITPDGKWHEPGSVGCWNISSASSKEEREWWLNYYDRFIKRALEENWHITIVDCHV
jgi:hypothetical protein